MTLLKGAPAAEASPKHRPLDASSSRDFIRIKEVGKLFDGRGPVVTALQNINLDIDLGEFVAVVGPSGCGKSTLLRILAGLIPTSSGTVWFGDRKLEGPRHDIGVVFQSPVLFPWRTVLDNVLIPIDVQKLDRKKYLSRARELINLVGLSEFEQRYPAELSGGMQQRVGIVRALVHDPAMLLMDEPFGALDAMTREKMNVELMRIQRETGKTVLLITHSIPEAVFLADRVLVMTERPGAIAAIYDVPLPRPRSLDAMADPAFTELVQRIRKHFFTQSALD